MAIAQSTGSSGIALAGINSSSVDQDAGRNEHLRSFELRYPPRKKTAPDATQTLKEQALESKDATKALGRASLFAPSTAAKKETYQRTLRLSRPKPGENTRLGVIATGLAPEGEIIAFDAGRKSPTTEDVVRKIRLGKGEEAADVDIIDTQNSGYQLAYCTNYEVYCAKFSPMDAEDSEPVFVYGTPHPDTFASTNARPKFRSLRFLARNLLLLLHNRPSRSGAELLLLEIPSPASLGNIILRKRLHRSIQTATALSVSLLPTSNPSENSQNVIAVAGQDNSVTILTLDHPSKPPFPSLRFRNHALLHNVHRLQITSLTLSIFHLPSDFSIAPPQYLKLASTSIASTVVVHTLPLTPYPLPTRKQRPNRYVLTSPGRGEAAQMTLSVLISALVIALGALVLQAFIEIRGGTPEYLGAKGWLSDRVHGWIAKPYMFEDIVDNLSVPGVETRPMKGVQGQLGNMKNSVKDAFKHPETVKVPGVETRPLEGMKSQAAETKDTVKDILGRPGGVKSPGVEIKPSDGMQSQAAEIVRNVKQQGKNAQRGGEHAAEGAQKAAEHAQQSVASVTDRAKASVTSAQEKLGLRDLLSRRSSSSDPDSASSQDSPSDIIVRHDEDSRALSADVCDADTVIGDAHKKWEELEAHERETWKRRLIDAGEWAVEEGEVVLKGVLFQNIALAVEAAARAEL